jgi:hypothetical protein
MEDVNLAANVTAMQVLGNLVRNTPHVITLSSVVQPSGGIVY